MPDHASDTTGDRLIAHEDPTRGQQFFDISEAETETVIPPHGMANDLGREAMILVESSIWLCVHAAITSLRLTLNMSLNNLTIPRSLLATHGFEVVSHQAEDPLCGFHTVWVAQAVTKKLSNDAEPL